MPPPKIEKKAQKYTRQRLPLSKIKENKQKNTKKISQKSREKTKKTQKKSMNSPKFRLFFRLFSPFAVKKSRKSIAYP